jgi:hypothetical protein
MNSGLNQESSVAKTITVEDAEKEIDHVFAANELKKEYFA